MPFDFKKFDAKCTNMSADELQREWEHYTRLIAGSATSTAVSGAAIPFTLGVSVIGVGLAAPAIHNARRKREIIERHLQRLGTTHHTRKRDVLTPMAISGTVGLVTLGVAGAGAGAITNAAVEHGIASIAANEIAVKATVHLAVDGLAVVGEEHHMKQKRLADAHTAWLMQQQQEKVAQSTIAPYNPSTFGNQSQTTTNTGCPADIKYEYSPVPLSSSVSEPILPPYSSPSYDEHQNYLPPQQYTEKCTHDNKTSYQPLPFQDYDTKATYYSPPTDPTQTRPQPYPVQTPPIQSYPAPSSSTDHTIHQAQIMYRQASTQQTPQLMYPSYPTTIIPSSAHQQYGRLDQVISELTISTLPPPPPPQVISRAPSPAPTPKPAAPTSRGYCTQPQQAASQGTSYFPPPSPITPASSMSYQHPTDSNNLCLSPPTTYHATPVMPSRSPSVSSIASYQPYSPGPKQAHPASTNQYGYMTPAPTPGSQYTPTSTPAQTQRQGSLSSQLQRQSSIPSHYDTHTYPPAAALTPAPTPGSTQPAYNHNMGYPTPIRTPCYSPAPTPQNYSQYPQQQQQPGYFQPSASLSPSYSQPSSQLPHQNQGNCQISQGQSSSHSHGQPYGYADQSQGQNWNQGYPTTMATPLYINEPLRQQQPQQQLPLQQRQSMYFPPPPMQPVK